MNYYERHLGDFVRDTAHLSMLEDGAYNRLLDRYYATEAGIPDVQKYRVARAHSKDEKNAVDAVLAEFFTLDDGVWIQKRAEQEIARFSAGEPEREVKKANEKNRLKRHRDERAELFKMLTDAGQHANWNVGITELREMVKRIQPAVSEVTDKPLPATAPATPATATRHQTPDTRHQTPSISVVESGSTHTEIYSEQGAQACAPTQSGAVCKRIIELGIDPLTCNPGNPTLQALLEAGATLAEFEGAARIAVERGKPFNYVIGTVKRQREEAAKLVLHQGRMPNKQEALENSNREVASQWVPPELQNQESKAEAA
jgi:uncharacterized protein YdaU (DUF1376 family)